MRLNAIDPAELPEDAFETWLTGFWRRLLSGRLQSREFEAVVERFWASGRIRRRAQAACTLTEAVLRAAGDYPPAGYGLDIGDTRFASLRLTGVPGRPAAIHVIAPPEASRSPLLRDKNRPPHLHDSGRIALILRGRAVFHVQHPDRSRLAVMEVPVDAGDMLFWPAQTAHTFDALDGFTLVSAMARYVDPASPEFALDSLRCGIDLDAAERQAYAGDCGVQTSVRNGASKWT